MRNHISLDSKVSKNPWHPNLNLYGMSLNPLKCVVQPCTILTWHTGQKWLILQAGICRFGTHQLLKSILQPARLPAYLMSPIWEFTRLKVRKQVYSSIVFVETILAHLKLGNPVTLIY